MGEKLLGSSPMSLPTNFKQRMQRLLGAEAEKLFKGLSAGGTVTMPLEKTFWSELFGMLTDKFGINWMMSYDPREVQ